MFISISNFAVLEKKINRLNKRLAKKNLPQITFTATNEIHTFEELFSKDVIKKYNFHSSYSVEVVNFNITSNVRDFIIESGYEIVAFIDHVENMVYPFIDNVNVEEFRNRHICDHCHTKRNRFKSIILRNTSTGELIQVGTTCLSDFIQINVDDLIKGIYSCITDYIIDYNNIGNDPFFKNFNPIYTQFNISDVIPVIYRAIKEYGFCPSSEGNNSTKMFVYKVLTYEEKLNVKEEDKCVTTKVIDWIMNLDNTSSFNENLIQIVKNGFVSYRTLGFLCAGVKTYIFDVVKKKIEKENTTTLTSEYVGTVGDKFSVDVIFTSANWYESFYGIMNIYTFLDNNGNIFMWKTSNNIKNDVGDKIKIQGTIKEHSEYKGNKQTVLTRVKVF